MSWSIMAKKTQATIQLKFFSSFFFLFFFHVFVSSSIEGALEDLSLPSDVLGEKRLNSSSAFVFPSPNYSSNIKNPSYNSNFFFPSNCLAMEKQKSSYSSGFRCSWPSPNNFRCWKLLDDGPKNPSCNSNPILDPSCSLGFFLFLFFFSCFFLGWEHPRRAKIFWAKKGWAWVWSHKIVQPN